MSLTSRAASLGLGNGAGANAGTGERRRPSVRWAPAHARFFFVREAREAAGEEQTRRPLARAETKSPTKALGCPCGLRTWMRCTNNAWKKGWTSRFLRRTCHG